MRRDGEEALLTLMSERSPALEYRLVLAHTVGNARTTSDTDGDVRALGAGDQVLPVDSSYESTGLR